LGGLPALTENVEWSKGDTDHARYMVKNDYIGHEEDPNNPWYTEAGAIAANTSDVMVSGTADTPDSSAIDLWMSGPFHGLGIIDPALSASGFGSYREPGGVWEMGACLDVIRGLGGIPRSITFPVLWPGDGETMPYTSYSGGEWPDPLSSCPGFTTPSGPPIYLQLGDGSLFPDVIAHSFQQAGTPLDHCVFDETTYSNSDSGEQDTGRTILSMRDAIILIPREPLEPGVTYTASITANGTTHTWSFTVINSLTRTILDSAIH
jgi:Cysteine-rich secretory protein family